jgi:hypothetical protein
MSSVNFYTDSCFHRTGRSSPASWSTSPLGPWSPCAGKEPARSPFVVPCWAPLILPQRLRAQFAATLGSALVATWSTAVIRRRAARERRSYGSARRSWSTGRLAARPGSPTNRWLISPTNGWPGSPTTRYPGSTAINHKWRDHIVTMGTILYIYI